MTADGSYLTRHPAADIRQMKSTSSPTYIPSANPAPAAVRRTTTAAPGTYQTRAPTRTMDGRAPMSRVELAPSYRASQLVPASCGTIRGATAPTAGSAKCGSKRSSQPGAGTQSESRNATSSVDAAASPVFRAAPGPPFTGRWITCAPCAAAMAAIAWGAADASSTTITRGAPESAAVPELRRPVRQRASCAWRSRTGITTVTSAGPGVRPTPGEAAQSG